MESQIDIPSIIENFKCPVCYDFMFPPFPQCIEGHNLCVNCFYRVKSCPICRADLCIITNNLLDEIYNMLAFPCPYEDCEEMVLGKLMQNHMIQCVHRNVTCKVCNYSGKMENMEQHFSDKHPE